MKALVIKTNEILDIENSFTTMDMHINFTKDDDKKLVNISHNYSDNRKDKYSLSNGNTYDSIELIIGIDEIRDYKIKNNLI